MTRRLHTPFALLCASLAAAGLVAACGGGSSSSGPAAVTTTTVSGSVVKGPVNGANVCAYKATAAGKGDLLACVTTNSAGGYTMDLTFVGDVVIEATGGSYTDETTGATTPLADPLQVVVASQGGTTAGVITPLTAVAYSLTRNLSGGVNSGNFASAAGSVAQQFQLGSGFNLASTAPTLGAAANAYGMALKGVSRFIANGGTLGNFIAWTNPTGLQGSYIAAYNAANGVSVNFNFSGNGTGTIDVGGTGAGGGAASCAVTVTGTITVQGFTAPLNSKFCITGLPTGAACNSGNASISQALAGQSGLVGAANLNYAYGTDCSGSQVTINLN